VSSKTSHCAYCEGQLRPFAQFSSERIVDVNWTAELQRSLPQLEYGRCEDCGSICALDARKSDEFDLLRLYEQLPGDYWAGLETRHSDRFFSLLEQQLNLNRLPLQVCDVGCGDGSFLKGLSHRWRKTGIEPGERAVAMLEEPDIEWIQGTLATASLPLACFDVITYIDVVEHLSDPVAELSTAWQYLKPGGKLVLYTGNAQSRFARLAGANWAYLRCAGHIAVASEQALTQGLVQAGFNNHIDTWTQNHPSSPGLRKWLFEYAGSRLRRHWAVPLYQDHILMIAQRPSEA